MMLKTLVRSTLLALAALASSIASAAPLKFAIMGDAGDWNSSAQQVRTSILSTDVRSLILPGDNLYSGTYDRQWSPWSSNHFTFDVVAIGNHNGGYSAEIAYFNMPGEFFSKVYAGVARFIVLNSDHVQNADAQARFLEQELTQATEPYIFVVYHHPSYTVSTYHSWDEKKAFQLAVRPVLWRNRSKLTALIVGHDHLAILAHFNDLPVIVSGAIKEQRSDQPFSNVQQGVEVASDWYFDGEATWAELSIDAEAHNTELSFIRARDNKIVCTANLATGVPAALHSNCQ